MKRILLSIITLLLVNTLFAQYDFKQNGRNDVPVLGWQMGLTGGGFTTMLTNRDDIDADQRLDPQMSNFSYGGGVERVFWFQNSIGFGMQLLYWKGGASYLGDDTITKIQMKAKTSMTYLKMPFMFHYKSYNRYHPDRAVRFTAAFGPYVSLMTSFQDKITYTKTTDPNYIVVNQFKGFRYESPSGNGEISGKIYNPFDIGMVFAVGGELRLARRSVLVLQLRTDIGFSNVENLRTLKFKPDNSSVETDFQLWNGYYAKYINPNALDIAKGFEPNRSATKNFSMGAFLTYRKYLAK